MAGAGRSRRTCEGLDVGLEPLGQAEAVRRCVEAFVHE